MLGNKGSVLLIFFQDIHQEIIYYEAKSSSLSPDTLHFVSILKPLSGFSSKYYGFEAQRLKLNVYSEISFKLVSADAPTRRIFTFIGSEEPFCKLPGSLQSRAVAV